MENDEFPKRKKSKTELRKGRRSGETKNGWDCLPAVIIDEIFQYLAFEDVLNASSTCRNWRKCLYHPRLWQNVTFVIEPGNLEQTIYLRSHVGCKVQNAKIRFNSMLKSCIQQFLLLLECFTTNNNLRGLLLEPSHCHMPLPDSLLRAFESESFSTLLLKICEHRSMTSLSLGCIEDLLQYVPELLASFAHKRPNDVHKLGLASVKDDPSNYLIYNFNANLLLPFQNLQIISLDYDNLTDELLGVLEQLQNLQRLVIHLHGIMEEHPGTTEMAWKSFVVRQPNCLLRLTLIHAFEEVEHLDEILKDNMPLSHLKVLFCEQMNLNALESLIKYRDTFVSLMWVDSLANEASDQYCLAQENSGNNQRENHHGPQNLMLLAWLCYKIKEIVVIGYKYCEEKWIGIAKLRSDTLKRLEIADDDLLRSCDMNIKQHIPKILGKSWSPLQIKDLHPVLLDPDTGDSDEYLMPILLSDLN